MTNHIISPEWLVATRADIRVEEMVNGGWAVKPAPLLRGASYTDFSTHEIAVPFAEGEQESGVRLHELMHSRLSPAHVPGQLLSQLGLSVNAMRLAEEVRVNMAGRFVEERDPDLGMISKMSDDSEVASAKNCVEKMDWNSALNLYLTTMNTDIHKKVKRRLRSVPEWKEAFAQIERDLAQSHMTYETHRTYRSIRGQNTSTAPIEFQYLEPKKTEPTSVIIPEGFRDFTLTLAFKIDQWLRCMPQKNGKTETVKVANDKPPVTPESPNWEALRFGVTSLTETTSAFLGKRKRPAMTGKYPSRPDRLLTDPERRIFREAVRSGGGVVVFDCSGSMSVTHDDIYRCVRQFSGATIVCYTNRGRFEPNTWVVARNGRMVSEREFTELDLNHGNAVDGPVLRWAINQRKTNKDFIIWVSDGAVTGRNDVSSHDLIKEVTMLSIRHNIIGAKNSREAITLLSDLKRTGKMPRQSFVPAIQECARRLGRNFI